MTTPSWQAIEDELRRRGPARLLRGAREDLSGDAALAHIQTASERLRGLGIEEGEVVAVLAEHVDTTLLALLACWHAGAVAFPLSTREPDSVLAELMERAGCRLLISPRPVAADGIAHLPTDRLLGSGPRLHDPLPDTEPCVLPGAATVLCTSGTNGAAKLVVHGLRQHIASARGAQRMLRLQDGDTWLLTLPFWHVGGLAPLFRALVAGASVALPDEHMDLPRALVHFQPSHVSLVSTHLVRLLGDDRAARALSGGRVVLAGGGPLPVPLRRWALNFGIPLMVSYGSTETASMVTAEREPLRLLEDGCAGLPLTGRPIVVDAQGEILVGGDTLLDGYLMNGRVVNPHPDDNMFSTRDTGRIDSSGRLFVTGRLDQMFFSGGENIQPEEIESALLEIEGISEAVVVPIPDPEYGHRPAAFVRHRPGSRTSRAVVCSQLSRQLPGYKIPEQFWILPESKSLKNDRGQLGLLATDPQMATELEAL